MKEHILEVENIKVRYSGLPVLRGVSLDVNPGETVCVVGANGSGKSTLLRAVMGSQRAFEGRIQFLVKEIQKLRTEEIVRLGVIYVPEEKMLFGPLTVEENLLLGAYSLDDKKKVGENLEFAYKLFPRLMERREQAASTLSGGEQQMVAIGRGLMSSPRVLMLDEPSLGLAPMLVQQIRDIIVDINRQGTSVLLIEQNANMALSIADYGYIMETGKVVMDGDPRKLLKDEDVQEFYLGLHGEGDRKSFRDVKHYKRRKRWLS